MSDQPFRIETFLPLVGQSFAASAEGLAPFRLELKSAEPLRRSAWASDSQPGFSLIFRVTEGVFPAQRTLRLVQADGTGHTFFCVPVLSPGTERRVQAIFN